MNDEEREKLAQAYIKRAMDEAPEILSTGHIINLMGFLVTSYASGPKEAGLWVNILAGALRDYYSDNPTIMH